MAMEDEGRTLDLIYRLSGTLLCVMGQVVGVGRPEFPNREVIELWRALRSTLATMATFAESLISLIFC